MAQRPIPATSRRRAAAERDSAAIAQPDGAIQQRGRRRRAAFTDGWGAAPGQSPAPTTTRPWGRASRQATQPFFAAPPGGASRGRDSTTAFAYDGPAARTAGILTPSRTS
jgi:hypothetical protein